MIVVAGTAPVPALERGLRALGAARRRGAAVIRVEAPGDPGIPAGLVDRIVSGSHAMGARWNSGSRSIEAENADALLFLPANVLLPEDADRAVIRGLASSVRPWGALRARWDGAQRHPLAATVLALLRASMAGLLLREQGLFFTRAAFTGLGGFDAIAEHEDLEISARACLLGRPLVLAVPALVQDAGEQLGAWERERTALRILMRRYNRGSR